MAGGRCGGRRPVPEVEVDQGRRQVPLSTFYSASQGQDDEEGAERRPPPEPTDGARGAEEDDDEGGCEGQPMETEDDASGAGSSGEAARAAKVYLRGPARLPQPPLPQNRPVIRPQRANVSKFRWLTSLTCQTPF
jgi:hypothetical protein